MFGYSSLDIITICVFTGRDNVWENHHVGMRGISLILVQFTGRDNVWENHHVGLPCQVFQLVWGYTVEINGV
jgi:hypothetical protein